MIDLNRNTWHDIDFYKADHRRQYDRFVKFLHSNFIPRSSRVPDVNEIVVFGMKILQIELDGLIKSICEDSVDEYKTFMQEHLGVKDFDVSHLRELQNYVRAKGRLPVQILALPEGTVVSLQTPVLTLENTDPRFVWFVNYIETFISATIWHPMTVASIARKYRQVFNTYSKMTSDIDITAWQGHDFSFRGMTNLKAGRISGMAHLLSFYGTDTVSAITTAQAIYGDQNIIAGSIPATEHSVMCCNGPEGETELYRRLLTEVYPTGPVAIVADSYDFWGTVMNRLPELRDVIMSRDGKLVIRPDSGDPVKIIVGDGYSDVYCENKGLIECLGDVFGITMNSKGYKQLDPHIGAIYGDSITLDRQEQILRGLRAKRYSSSNVVLGIGSYSYQCVTRDTFGFAMKATAAGDSDKNWKPIYKQPKTDSGKNSRRGRLAVVDGITYDNATPEQLAHSDLIPLGSDVVKFNQIRERLWN